MTGIPSYCQASAPGQNDGPVRLKRVLVRVPDCPRGHHGAIDVVVRIGGNGVPLVVARGYTGSSLVYLLTTGLIARRVKVIGVDLAGHGETPGLSADHNSIEAYADLLLCTLDALGIERAVFVGHSLGGQVVAQAVKDCPKRAIAVGLVNAITGQHWDEQVCAARESFLRWRTLPVAWDVAAEFLRLFLHLGETDEDTTLRALSSDTWRRYLRHPGKLIPAFQAMLNGPPTVDMLRSLRKHRICTFVFCGGHDPIVGLADAENTSKLSGGDLIVIPDAGHLWLLANRWTLPDQVDVLLGGKLGARIGLELKRGGLDPRSATQADVEASRHFYADGALARMATPPRQTWQPPATTTSVIHRLARFVRVTT